MRRKLLGIVLLLWLGLLLPVAAPAGAGEKLYGSVVSPPKPAPDFELKDGTGKRLRLSSLRGKVVGLTFVFTQCPLVCPTMVARLKEVADGLGDRYGKEVVFLLVSVDPEGDTPQAVRRYEEAHGIRWPYLIGPEKNLAQVWQDYGVFVEKRPLGSSVSHGSHSRNYTVDHTAKLILIDAQGLMRVQIPGYVWPPDKVRTNLEMLARERR
jgi:protein SCO1/2